jgi:CHAD domain-containing protein
VGDHREVELTWTPAPDAQVPDLACLPGVERVVPGGTDELAATYFDTDALDLMAAGVTLRRRVGGTDEGWHLKVPAGAGRDEVHLPLSRSRHVVPKRLREAVNAWSRGAALAPVATIDTRRTTYHLLGPDGAELAELADDRVCGRAADDGAAPVEWREWELELVTGDPSLLEAATVQLAEQDVGLSAVQRKVERVLGDRVPHPLRSRRPRPGRPAGRVLVRLLVEQRAELARRDSEIRRAKPDAVHRARIATRRMRSALGAYGTLLDAEVARSVGGQLRWLAHVLGESRDTEVVHERLLQMLDEEPAERVVGPVRRRIGTTYAGRQRQADERVRAALDSPRYLELLASLDRLVLDPPWTEQAREPARDVFPALVREEWRALRRRVRAIEGAGAEEDAGMHEARRAAKRVRYVVDALVPVWGDDARRLAAAAKRMSSVLGERHDTVVVREHLAELATAATAAGESAFTYGCLHAREEARAARLNEDFARLWADDVNRKKLRAWLR